MAVSTLSIDWRNAAIFATALPMPMMSPFSPNETRAVKICAYSGPETSTAQNQATDRTHRIGQKNVVTVYELIAEATIEEQILNLQKAKSDLVEEILSGDGIRSTVLNRDELLQML